MEGFKNEKRKIEFVLGRAAVRSLLAEETGYSPGECELAIAENGAPVFCGQSRFISITHTSDVAAAVVASRPVGIDIEQIRPRHPSLERYLLHPDETTLIAADPVRSLVLLWTLKEAALKANGTGLRLAPRHVLVELRSQPGKATIYQPDGTRWSACYEERDGMYLAIAFQDDDFGNELFDRRR